MIVLHFKLAKKSIICNDLSTPYERKGTVMVSGLKTEAKVFPFTRKERLVIGLVVGTMALLGLSSHFFGIPTPSPEVPTCQMASNCGAGDPYFLP